MICKINRSLAFYNSGRSIIATLLITITLSFFLDNKALIFSRLLIDLRQLCELFQ